MKSAVLYYSKSGHTKKMAEIIAKGMEQVENVEAHAISIEEIDEQWVQESSCIVLGTYMESAWLQWRKIWKNN